ncbi:rhomboid family intramembrane serine protease [Flavobacterium sp.]|uniref:rhomboid family intramembrane serine protease n=1 Tax=Flavobacterium sp. TaxID=239 RepID=UPI00374CCCED
MNNMTPAVKQLLIINIIFFLGSQIPNIQEIAYTSFSLYSFGSPNFRIWQLVTHMFMHAPYPSLSHIIFNMFALVSFGSILESLWGSKKFLFFYFSCGLAAAMMNNLVNQYYFGDIITSAVGASGAIYGLLIAFAFMFPNAELSLMFIPIPVKAKYFVPIYMLLYDGLFGVFGNSFFGINTGIANFAHIGGALCGFIMMWYWKKNSFNDKRWN